MTSDTAKGDLPTSADGSTTRRNPRTSRTKSHRRLLYGGVSLGALVLLLTTSVLWLGYRAEQIQSNLSASSSLLIQLKSASLNGENETAQAIFADLQDHTSLARDASTDPLWLTAGHVPFLGSNFSAITEVAVTADDVVNRAISPLLEELDTFDWENLAPTDGHIPVAPIESASPKLSTAANTVQLSYERLSAIDRSGLLPQVSEPLAEATTALREASDALTDAASAAQILPAMLGSEGPREYLLLIQNSAEVRATGGIPGALAVIRTDQGNLELAAQGSASGMGRFEPAIIVDPDQALIYSTRMGRFAQSVNLTPDFPTAAETAARMWETRNEGTSIDGVVALDPIALSHILGATGPVELSFEDPFVREFVAAAGLPEALTAENVIPTLLSDIYKAIEDPSLQDAYFAAVASEIFDALSSGTGQSSGLIQALRQSSDEGRLYLWSANPDEQKTITSTALVGSMTGAGSGGAAFGAYFNDGTGAKMDYYMRRTVQLHRTCSPDGFLQYTITVTLSNTAPADAANSLPAYVTGGGAFGVEPGTVRTNFVAYGPDQSQLQTARIDGEQVPLGSHRHNDRPVGVVTTNLTPGQSATIEMDFTNVVQSSHPKLDVTPTVQPLSEVVLPMQGDGSCI